MLKVLLLIVAFSAVLSLGSIIHVRSSSDQFINEINKRAHTWEAERNLHPQSFNKRYMDAFRNAFEKLPRKQYNLENITFPDHFDAREQWPNCPSIQEIQDQGNCSSDWALAAAETISDRICIFSNGQRTPRISANYLLACSYSKNLGCIGGYSSDAWLLWKNRGAISGGTYGSNQGCQPYELQPCEHTNTTGDLPSCSNVPGYIPECKNECENPIYDVPFEDDLNYGSDIYPVFGGAEQIQAEIYQNGPVNAVIALYEDFLNYKSGIYKQVYGDYVTGLAVKIIGWGVEDDTPYWLVANSWNTNWGEKGFFKILRGSDECQVEDFIIGGTPDFNTQEIE